MGLVDSFTLAVTGVRTYDRGAPPATSIAFRARLHETRQITAMSIRRRHEVPAFERRPIVVGILHGALG
jgi:hypothetical protein